MKDNPMLYMLDELHRPVPCHDTETWGRWFAQTDNRIVKQEEVGDYFISTVFLALDHAFGLGGPPILFETMIFHGTKLVKRRGEARRVRIDEYQDRCSTWAEAEAMHARAVYLCQERIANQKDIH